MSDSNPPIPPKSAYPELEKPEFKSTIPPHLLIGASPSERYLMESQSRMESFMDWSARAHVMTHTAVKETNGRLLKAEANISTLKDDKRTIVRGWRFMLAIGAGLSGLVGFFTALWTLFGGGAAGP